jgi:hypothetical protein
MYILDVAMGVLYVFDLLLKLHLACVIQFGYYKVLITNGPGILRIYAMEVRGCRQFKWRPEQNQA